MLVLALLALAAKAAQAVAPLHAVLSRQPMWPSWAVPWAPFSLAEPFSSAESWRSSLGESQK